MEIKALTQAQAAELMGVSGRRARQIFKESAQMPIQNSRRQYPVKEFGQWLLNYWRAGLKISPDGEVYDFQVEKARLTKNQADEKELQVAVLQGDLIPAETVEAEWSDAVASMRSKLLGLPTRLASKAIAADSLRDIEEFTRGEIYAALNELAEYDDGETGLDESPAETETAATLNG